MAAGLEPSQFISLKDMPREIPIVSSPVAYADDNIFVGPNGKVQSNLGPNGEKGYYKKNNTLQPFRGDIGGVLVPFYNKKAPMFGQGNALAAQGNAQYQMVIPKDDSEPYLYYMDHAYHNVTSDDTGEVPDIGKTAISVAALDTGVALLAGIAIFPIVFANGLAASEGPGLVFVTLPIAFSSMPLGVFFGTLFFVLLSIAALSSSISLIEPGVAWLIESLRIKRITATLLLGFIAWFIGLFSALSFNLLSEFTIFGKNFFDATDFLTNQIMLPLGGIFIAIFVGWVMKKENVLDELDVEENLIFKFWYFSIRYISPVMVGCVFLYFFI